MKIAGVRFRDNSRVYDFDASDVDVRIGDDVVVESDRGQGFARVVRLREGDALPEPPGGQERKERQGGRKEGGRAEKEKEEEIEIEVEVETPGSIARGEQQQERPLQAPRGHRKVVRRATEDDLQRADRNRGREHEAFRLCQDMISERELPMKLIRAEYSFDASRVTFYFFSETRVDFRELVKDLAHNLRSRIEMRQVGVRDVARMIGGFGPCGRELCCTSHLRGFEPVSIRMAKKQEMVLNPAKISGVCGRLLCCLSYEFEMYDAIKKDVAELKEASAREKREAEERRLSDLRREVEEHRRAEERHRREEDQRKQEQRQRDRQRPGEQPKEGRKQEKKDERPEQKGRPPQDQKGREAQAPQEKQQPQRPEPSPQAKAEGGAPAQQPAPGEGKSKKRRRFWRKKKKKQGGERT